MVLGDPEDDGDDVLGGVAQVPQVGHHFVRLVNVTVHAVLDHVFDE